MARSVARKLQEVYADKSYGRGDRRTLDWVSGWLTANEADRAVRAVRRYNSFEGDEAAEAIQTIGGMVDNNAKFAVGRESSPVIYVSTSRPEEVMTEFRYMEHAPDELSVTSRGTKKQTFSGFGPSAATGDFEFGRTGHRTKESVVRAWWD